MIGDREVTAACAVDHLADQLHVYSAAPDFAGRVTLVLQQYSLARCAAYDHCALRSAISSARPLSNRDGEAVSSVKIDEDERMSSTAEFWTGAQPGFRFTEYEPGTPEFFRDVERHRYALEPHIPEIVRFDEWRGADVLEVGCGIGTDASRFARFGAHYTGVDQTDRAIELARRRFALDGFDGTFLRADAKALPFPDESFDLVFSHGVIHHVADTYAAVKEIHRVLRPRGVALVMVYHRGSLNYRFNILIVRRLLAATLGVPGSDVILRRIAPADGELVAGHRELLRIHGLRYLTDLALFLSNNTDGPGNPLSKVFSRREARDLFCGFSQIDIETRYLNLRLYPMGDRLAATRVARWLERRIGWYLYIRATR
jgi:SAM-dependent methyltransferase